MTLGPVALHCTFEELQCSPAIPALCGEDFEHLTFVIEGTPEVVHLSVDPYEHLIKMPTPVRPVAPVYAPPPDLASEHRSKPIPPVPHRLVADVDATFEQNVFNLAQRQRIADIQHHSEANDLARTVEITEGILHSYRLEDLNGWLKTIYSDNAGKGDKIAITSGLQVGLRTLEIKYEIDLSDPAWLTRQCLSQV